jgi:hypothetical protein
MPIEQLLALEGHAAVGAGKGALGSGEGSGAGVHGVLISLMCGLDVPLQCVSAGKGKAAFRAIEKTIFHVSVRDN